MVVLVIVSSFWAFRRTEDAAEARRHTSAVLSGAEEFLSALKDAETGERGYLLTGDEAFLEPYLAVRDSAREQLEALRQLTTIVAARHHLDNVAPLLDARLAGLSQVIESYRQHNEALALALERSAQGKRLMDAIRSEMRSFGQLEDSELLQRDVAFQANLTLLLFVISIASLLTLALALAFAYLTYRESLQRLKNRAMNETQRLLEVQEQSNKQLHQANLSLQVSEEKLAVTLNSIGDGVIATDAAGLVTLLNPLAEKLTGWTQSEAYGQVIDKVFKIINQDTRQPCVVPVMETIHSGRVQGLANHTVLIARSGSECAIADSCAPIRDRNARVLGSVLVFRDVTEDYAAQAAMQEKNRELIGARALAEQANRAKSEFLATMSHEIRTPMNGVIGMIEVLEQSSLNGPQMAMANIIHDSAFSLLAVIDDVLDFSQIEAGKLSLESIPMSIADVVEGVGQTMDRMALKKDVELTLFTDPALPAEVLGDAGRLRQVLINLVNNAIKFSSGLERTGQVSLRALLAQSTPEQVVLEFLVADNGIGMDDESQARLFSPFMQADSTTTRNFGGTGLGLVISRRLTQIMGGEITLHSELAKGTALTVRIPFARKEAISEGNNSIGLDRNLMTRRALRPAVAIMTGRSEMPCHDAAPSDAASSPLALSREETCKQGRLMLVAEDNETNQKVILQQLLLLGYTADVASNGREALKRWLSGDYAILFADLHMPEMDGYELTIAIRTLEAGKAHLPIIAFTANAIKGEAEHCVAIGMDDYLSKPVQLVNLKAMLKKWLPVLASTPISAQTRSAESDCSAASVVKLPVPVDLNVLKALIGSDEAVLREFLGDFRASASCIAVDLQAACAAGEPAATSALAHKLKSPARSVGALKLGDLCEAMEKAGKSGDTQALVGLLPNFDQEWGHVDGFLQRYQ